MEFIRITFRTKQCNEKQPDEEAQPSDESIKVLNTYPEVEESPPTVQAIGLNRNYDLYPEDCFPDVHQYKRERDRLERKQKNR